MVSTRNSEKSHRSAKTAITWRTPNVLHDDFIEPLPPCPTMKLTTLINTALAVVTIALAASSSTVSKLGATAPEATGHEIGYAAGELTL
jgi:hypothetical protein